MSTQISSVNDCMIAILKLARECTTEAQATQLEEVAGPIPFNTFEGPPPVGHPRPAWFTATVSTQISSVDDCMIAILKLARECTTEAQATRLEEVAGPIPSNTFEGTPPVGHPRPAWFTG
ncbi:hypothetical protein TrCOL_g1533 [Triparma columacea]|uniref:Uncharacterized protein n=1 Tax=Triparma columacea TaxID=722753 RepID=A0A9W7L7M3_9STRA|nr:hypothetical protein TrCOL_g1533 [Triparma columacea]